MTRLLAGVQLSLATTFAITLGTAAWQLASAETVIVRNALNHRRRVSAIGEGDIAGGGVSPRRLSR